jgi:hypothetical protein
MLNGALSVFLYYALGFIIAWIAYESEETHYAHGPGLRELIVFLTLLIGFVWFAIAIVRYSKNRSQISKGSILAHITVFFGFAIFLFFLANTPNKPVEENSPEVVVEENGDTLTMYHHGNPIYFKVKDSVLINFIDSSRIDWSKVEYRKK